MNPEILRESFLILFTITTITTQAKGNITSKGDSNDNWFTSKNEAQNGKFSKTSYRNEVVHLAGATRSVSQLVNFFFKVKTYSTGVQGCD